MKMIKRWGRGDELLYNVAVCDTPLLYLFICVFIYILHGRVHCQNDGQWHLYADVDQSYMSPSSAQWRKLMFGSVLIYVHRNRRLIRDGSPGRPPRLTFTQLQSWCPGYSLNIHPETPATGHQKPQVLESDTDLTKGRDFSGTRVGFY